MSKIFDALQGTRSEVSDLLPSLIADRPTVAGRAIPASEPQPAGTGTLPAGPVESPVPERIVDAYATAYTGGSSIRRVKLAIPASSPLLPFENPREHAAEQYRIARTRLSHHPKQPRMIVISSSSAGDGKSLTAINLAGVLSLKGDANVLLLDADFRRSAIHLALGLPKTPGLAEVVTGKCSLEDAVLQTEQYPNLNILVNGDLGNLNPSEVLDSPRWQALCQLVRTRYQYIIVDSPPVAAVADFDLIQMVADGTILVVRPDHSKRSACFKAIDLVPKEKFLGVILNCAESWLFHRDENYGYNYRYHANAAGNGTGNGTA